MYLNYGDKMAKAKILTRLIGQLERKGMDAGKAQAIAISSLRKSGNLKKDSLEPTKKGLARGNMSPSERAKDRAVKSMGGKASDYVYHSSTNTVTKKRK